MKMIILGLAMMGTATAGSNGMFETAQSATGQMTAVYAAAGEINHFADIHTRAAQQDKLFEVASHLEPFAQEFGKADEQTLAMLNR